MKLDQMTLFEPFPESYLVTSIRNLLIKTERVNYSFLIILNLLVKAVLRHKRHSDKIF